MAYKQSFQFFDAIMDDPPLKPPLAHRHYPTTLHEPAEDHSCYLCTDHQPVRTMASGEDSEPWNHFHTQPHVHQHTNKKVSRPEEAHGPVEGHHHHRQSKKVMLVMNSDPSVRRTIVLRRRSLRSLALFMDEVSELMQSAIRKLYTLEGHRIDSVQALLQCPGTLVCVGRESFHPLLCDNFRKNSYDKLPRLNVNSHSSVCSEEKAAKKNVNFGLETKKSVIHSRCESNTRPVQCPNRLNSLPHRHRLSGPHGRESTTDENIEKRVLVNKDGSMSMEMKVRFQLLNDETLHWSTEVKKSKGALTESYRNENPWSLSHGSAESFSEAESFSAGEAEETHKTKPNPRQFQESSCRHCCAHCHEYDSWISPMLPHQSPVRQIRSSSSSSSSHRLICKKASTDSMRTMSSEEYTEHVIEKASCIQQSFGPQSNTTLEHCTINHCCRCSTSTKTTTTAITEEHLARGEINQLSDNDENKLEVLDKSKKDTGVEISQAKIDENRPSSNMSSSSLNLASQNEGEDLSKSNSRASHNVAEDGKDSQPNSYSSSPCLTPRPPSKGSSSNRSKTSRRYVHDPQDKDGHIHITRPEIPVFSNATSEMCKCVKTNNHIEDDQTKKAADDRASSAMSSKSTSSNNVISTEFLKSETIHKTKSSGSLKISEARTSSSLSVKSNSSCPSKHPQVLNKDAGLSTNHNELNGQLEHRPDSSISLKSNTSAKSKLSIELSELEIEESDRAPSSFSILSSISKSDISDLEEKEPLNSETVHGERSVSSKSKISTKTGSKDSWQDKTEVQEINYFQERASSAGSSENAVKKNKNLEERLEHTSRNSASMLECDQSKLETEAEKRASSAMSARSEVSTLSKSSEQLEERTSSAISAKSNVSARSNLSKISHGEGGNYQDKCDKASHNSKSFKIPNKDRPLESEEEKRSTSALSTKSHVSAKSYKSNVSDKADEDHTSSDKTERTPSALSSKSAFSTKSKKSEIQDQEERAQSALSAKSIVSSRSNKSMTMDILSNGVNQEERSSEETKDQIEERATSVVSSMSAVSAKSRRSESEERAPSAMSAKSIASTRSEKSKISECVSDGVHQEEKSTEEQQDQLEERATSVMSFISAISGISGISGQSEAQNQVEERAPSALSAKSRASAQSNMSKISDFQTDGVNQIERALTPLSAISNMSRRSKLSDVSARAKDNNERTPSVMSRKSDLSTKSNSSKCKANRVSDESSHEVNGEEKVISLPQTPTSAISINEERSPSAVSVISEKSEATSNKPEITIEEENNARPQSAVSVKSFVSAIIIEEPDDQNDAQAPSSRSDTSSPDNLVNEEKENTERTESALSCFSDVSASSLKSSDSELRKNTDKNATSPNASHTSAGSRRSNVSEEARRQTRVINAADLRPSSALSAKSCASQESKTSERLGQATSGEIIMTERTASSLSKKSNGSSTSNAPQNSDKGRISKLSIKSDISTKSNKTKISENEDHCNALLNNVEIKINPKGPDCSDVSDKTNTSLYNCGEVAEPLSPTDSSEKHFDVEEPASPLSKNSSRHRISPSGSVSERVLTPTSTSVSIGIEEDNEVDDYEEANAVASKTLRSSASSKTETLKNDRTPSQSTLQLANERKTATPEEQPIRLASSNSNGSKKSKSKCSHCSSSCYSDANRNKSSKSNLFPSEFQPANDDKLCCSSSNNKADQTGEERNGYLDVAHECQSISSTSSTKTKENIPIALVESASPISSASFTSPDSGKSRINNDISDRPRSNMSGQKISVKALVNGIEQACQSQKTSETERENSRCHSATLSIKSCNRLSPNPPKSPKKCKRSLILQASSNESMLSQTDSACHNREKIDHLNAPEEDITSNKSDGTQNNQRQTSNTGGNSIEINNKCRKKLRTNSSCKKLDDGISDLTPSCLPNASPTEVVNEWLRKIPSDTEMCQLGDELHENFNLVDSLCTTLVPSGDGHGSLEGSSVTKLETPSSNFDKAEDATNNVVEENLAISKNTIEHKPSESENTVFDSSVLVMKVLLSPKLNRCHSLPEVSPTYGRKLSKSAQGLLDCLANLQLLDFGHSDKHCKEEKYQELMGMFKSLWLCDPKDSEKTPEETEAKAERPLDEENKAKSSSGVDINSGSTGSGNSSVVSSQPQTKINCEGPEVLTKVQEVDEPVEQESSAISDSKPNSNMCAESDSQQNHDLGAEDASEDQLKDDVLGSNETISNNDSPREIIETPLSSNQRETESDRQAETSSDSPSVLPKSQLTKRISQDPDPVWILNLLNKLEKQFMAHYVSAMAEFKIRWNLDDNEQLDIMICELRDEVHRRIQSSIDRELRKIQGRAGRPRPPKETVSRESSVQTEQRRRRLKVMRNQSIDPQRTKSDDYYTLTGTDFSDQRSDDEYCPCDTCVKKKMVSKQALPIEMFNSAPVMIDFDLRRILHMKKSPSNEDFERLNSECKANRIDEDNREHEDVKDEEDATAETDTLEVTEAAEEDNTEEDNETADVVSADVQADEVDPTAEEDEVSENDKVETDEVDHNTEAENVEINETTEDDETNNFDKTAEEDETAEDDNTAEKDESAEDDNPAEDEATEVDNTAEEDVDEVDNTAEDDQTDEVDEMAEVDNAAKEDEATEVDNNLEDGFDEVDNIAKEGETAKEDKTVEDDETDEVDITAEECEMDEENKTAEDDETDEVDNAAEDDETDEVDNNAEEGETGEANISAEKDESDEVDNTTEGEGTDEVDNTAVDGIDQVDNTADENVTEKADNTAEDDETDEVDNTAEEGETAEIDETAEADKVAKEGGATVLENTAEDGIDEDETAEAYNTSGGDETAEDDKNAEEDETAEADNTAEEDETVEADNATEDDETAEAANTSGEETAEADNTAEEDETAEADNTAGEDETAEADNTAGEDETAEDDNTAGEDETAEDDNTAEDETAEDDNAAEEDEIDEADSAAEEGETAETDNTAEEDETAEADNTAEEDETAEADNTAGEDETDEADNLEDDETDEVVNTAEEGDTDEVDNNAEEDETAEADNTAGEDETPEVDNTAEEDETAEADNTAEKDETPEADNTAGEEETAEAENTAEEDETPEADNTAEEETAEADNTAEDGETAETDNAAGDETAEADNAAGDETAEADNTAEEDETAEADNTAEEDKTAEDDNTAADDETDEADNTADECKADEVDNTAEESETDEVDNMAEGDETDEVVSAAEEVQTAEADNTAEEGETDEADNTAGEGETEEVDNTPEEDETDEAVSAAEEGETEEVVNTAEEETEEVVDAEESETAEADNTAEEGETGEADNSAEDDEKEKEGETIENNNIVETVETVEPNEEASELTEKVKDCPSGVDEENKTVLEIEEETIENDIVALVTTEDKGKESGIDEDSEITTRNGIVANTGESAEAGDEAEDDTEPDIETEGEQDGTSPALTSVLKPEHCEDVKDQKRLKILVNHNSESEDGAEADGEDSETEIRSIENNVSSELEENKVENSDEDETPERTGKDSDSSLEKKNASKIVKEKTAFLSDITEDTAEDEENQKNTDDVTTDSQVGEYESSENSLAKQMTKSSVESQPGSFDEVFNSQTKRSNHVAMDAN